jgi:hypothetical protein
MTDSRMSYQQLDPVGSYGSRPITLVISMGIAALAIGATSLSWAAVTDPTAAILAVVTTTAAVLGINFWTSPLRAPFRLSGFVTVMVFSALSLVFGALSIWGTPVTLVDQWTPITVGLILVQLSSYRPARELVGATVLGGILAGFVTVLHTMSGGLELPPLVGVLDASLPVVALGAGATAYSSVVVRSLGQWYSQTPTDGRAASEAMRDRIVRSVQDDRVSILNHTVVPFFTDLLERDKTTNDDRIRAQAIANTIRAVMVADVDRSWLDTILDHLVEERGDSSVPGSEVVQDPHRAASGMTTEQRIVVRAVVVALFDHPGFDADGFAILITRAGGAAVVSLTAKLDDDESVTRSSLAPYLAVLRIAFRDLHLTFQPPTLTLKFSYEHK